MNSEVFMNNSKNVKGTFFMVLAAVMAVVSFFVFYLTLGINVLPGFCFFLLWITIPLVINGIAVLIYNIFNAVTKKDNRMILPFSSLTIAIISAFVGILLYVNDHAFMLRGLEAELTWFFISLPALAVAIIHFVIMFVQMSKKVRLLEKQN